MIMDVVSEARWIIFSIRSVPSSKENSGQNYSSTFVTSSLGILSRKISREAALVSIHWTRTTVGRRHAVGNGGANDRPTNKPRKSNYRFNNGTCVVDLFDGQHVEGGMGWLHCGGGWAADMIELCALKMNIISRPPHPRQSVASQLVSDPSLKLIDDGAKRDRLTLGTASVRKKALLPIRFVEPENAIRFALNTHLPPQSTNTSSFSHLKLVIDMIRLISPINHATLSAFTPFSDPLNLLVNFIYGAHPLNSFCFLV